MTTSGDARARAVRAAARRLLGTGGPFELVEEHVLGAPTPVFAHRTRSLSDVLVDSLRHGARDCIVTRDRRITFAQHGAMVAALARALREEHGVRPGDRVGIVAGNSPEWLLTFWATVSLGAIAVGYNSWWSPRELAHGVLHARPRLIVADRQRATRLRHIEVPVLTMEEDLPRLIDSWPVQEPAAALGAVAGAEDDPAVILYTSGTTGRPKGAVHTQRNLLAVVDFHRYIDALHVELGRETAPWDRNYLLTMPLFHIGSLHNLAVPRLATGSQVTMSVGPFDVDAVLTLVERERVTNWGAVPTMATRLLEHPDLGAYDTSSLTAFAVSTAPTDPAFRERLRRGLPFGAALVDSYGLTESCTAVTAAGPVDLAESPGTLGFPIPGVRLEIRDPLGEPVPPGTEGEICVLSAYNMLGYWEDAAADEGAFGPGRWLRTGDLGELDEQGRVRLSARRSDLVIRGGENVYPAEVEAALLEHPDINECLVHGVPHDDLGQEVAVVAVSARSDHAALEAELRSWVRTEIAPYKVPTRWRFTQVALPRNATGKILRRRVVG